MILEPWMVEEEESFKQEELRIELPTQYESYGEVKPEETQPRGVLIIEL